MSRVLVTGCDGFVGRVMVDRLRGDGHDVYGVDRTDSGAAIDADKRFSGDLTDRAVVDRIMEVLEPERVVHLAAQASVRDSYDRPVPTILNNTMPILHLLNHVRETGKDVRVLAIGSADEYGTVPAERMPLKEDTPVEPASPYALAKSIQNQCCTTFSTLYHVDAVLTRSFNHTGAGQRDAFVLPSFARQVAEIKAGKSEPVMHVGNLDVRRDFLDVRDVCAAYAALLEKGERGVTYNVCSGKSYHLREMLDQLCAIAGVEVEIKVDPERLRPVDMPELRGDATRIREATGWEPAITIEETLRALVDHWVARTREQSNANSN